MPLKLLFVAALFLLVLNLNVSSGTFCDEGPPGRYCYKDLTGWYECVYDSKTKTMNQTKHQCPANMRLVHKLKLSKTVETRAQPACASRQKSCVKMARMLWRVWKQYDLSLFLFVIKCIKLKLENSISHCLEILSRVFHFFPFPFSYRCQCFYGPSCESTVKDPCAKYELPPPFPAVFSTFYTETVTTCDNKQCKNTTIIGDMQQNATAGEQRHDIVGTGWNTRFIFPFRYIDFDDFIQVYYEVFWTLSKMLSRYFIVYVSGQTW